MLKALIRRWLGLDQVLWNLQDMRENRLNDRYLLNSIAASLTDQQANFAITNRGVARLVGKLDPMYHQDEFDPARRAESDRIENEVISRLYAEHKASNPNG